MAATQIPTNPEEPEILQFQDKPATSELQASSSYFDSTSGQVLNSFDPNETQTVEAAKEGEIKNALYVAAERVVMHPQGDLNPCCRRENLGGHFPVRTRASQVVGIPQTEKFSRGAKVLDLSSFRQSFVPNMVQELHLLTVRDVAQILKLSTATVYGLVSAGKLPSIRTSQNSIRVSEQALRAFLERCGGGELGR